MVAFDGVQVLDVTGPLEVFSAASRWLERERGRGTPAYAVEVAAARRGPLRASSGIELVAARALPGLRGGVDTLLVAGGVGVAEAAQDRVLLRALRRLSAGARRYGSVCTGAELLARAGLLDGRRVATHWAFCETLAARHPRLRVESDPIFVRDGRCWTSAGVTAGMDLALALVEEDHGRDVALAVARWLVLFLKRPGGQSQFSAQLAAQQAEREPLRAIQDFVLENPAADLSVPALARRAGMSPRNFARVFAREVGATPARFVERARVERARRRLEESADGMGAVATECGFGSEETLRRAFLRALRVGPAEYRARFRVRAS